MAGAKAYRSRESRGWLPAWPCPWPDVRAGLLALVVMAGLLAMHALTAGHTGHMDHGGDTMTTAGQHAARSGGALEGAGQDVGHRHTGDRHVIVGAPSGAGASSSKTLADATSAPGQAAGGHEPCPYWMPGHCPDLPMPTSVCQAVLNGGGGVLLLLLLLALTLAARDTTRLAALRAASPHACHVRWRAWRWDRRMDGLSMHELCISRT